MNLFPAPFRRPSRRARPARLTPRLEERLEERLVLLSSGTWQEIQDPAGARSPAAMELLRDGNVLNPGL